VAKLITCEEDNTEVDIKHSGVYCRWDSAGLPYCHLWHLRSYNIFPHYLIKGTIFEKKNVVTEHKMCVLISSSNFVRNVSLSKEN